MTPRMLHQAQAQETAYQYGLEENKTKIDYCGSFVPSGLASLFARGAKTPFLAMSLARLSVCLETKRYNQVKSTSLLLRRAGKPLHSIASKAVCGGVA